MAFLARDRSTQEWLKRVHVLRADAPCPEVDKQLTEGLMLSRRRTSRGERALRSHTGTHVDVYVYVYVGVFVYVCISTTLKANTHTHAHKLKAQSVYVDLHVYVYAHTRAQAQSDHASLRPSKRTRTNS